MNLMVSSMFRDASYQQVERWLQQVDTLAREWTTHGGDKFSALAVEGDSVDDTLQRLVVAAYTRQWLRIEKIDNHAIKMGSVVHPVRMGALSKTFNGLLGCVPADVDTLIHVESDLIWSPETLRLLAHYSARHDAVVAPLIFAGEAFYDIWAFRKDGVGFNPFPPYHSGLNMETLTQVDSVGSCLAIPGELARNVRILDNNAIVGWCDEARRVNSRILVAPWLRVDHPA